MLGCHMHVFWMRTRRRTIEQKVRKHREKAEQKKPKRIQTFSDRKNTQTKSNVCLLSLHCTPHQTE